MELPIHYSLTPRHLIFNILAQCKGEITRQELLEDMYEVGCALGEKGYKISVNLKGSKTTGYWNEHIDGELEHWLKFGIIQEREDQRYIFEPKERKPFDSLMNILLILNDGLESETVDALHEAINKIVTCK